MCGGPEGCISRSLPPNYSVSSTRSAEADFLLPADSCKPAAPWGKRHFRHDDDGKGECTWTTTARCWWRRHRVPPRCYKETPKNTEHLTSTLVVSLYNWVSLYTITNTAFLHKETNFTLFRKQKRFLFSFAAARFFKVKIPIKQLGKKNSLCIMVLRLQKTKRLLMCYCKKKQRNVRCLSNKYSSKSPRKIQCLFYFCCEVSDKKLKYPLTLYISDRKQKTFLTHAV